MKFLIDECVLGSTTSLLKEWGFSVVTIQELGKTSLKNGEVLNLARAQKAILVTIDLDFSNINPYPLNSHEGIIVLRPRREDPQAIEDIHKILIHLLKEINPEDFNKSLIIVDKDKFRIRKE